MTAAELTPQEIAAALAARRELGPEYEDAIAASLAEKVEREIAARVSAAQLSAMQMQVNAVQPNAPRQRRQPDGSTEGRWIGVASLIAGIPVTGIVAGTSHGSVGAIAVAWGGIALVNMAHAFGRRKH
ncbi:MAG: hypothetical protein ACRDVE_11355 [Actinocrinis sp.]